MSEATGDPGSKVRVTRPGWMMMNPRAQHVHHHYKGGEAAPPRVVTGRGDRPCPRRRGALSLEARVALVPPPPLTRGRST